MYFSTVYYLLVLLLERDPTLPPPPHPGSAVRLNGFILGEYSTVDVMHPANYSV